VGPCTVHDRTAPDEVVPRSLAAGVVLTNKTVISREAIAELPALRYIGVLATGYNVVAVEAASERGIVVSNVPAYGTRSVAQMVFAHLLNLCHRVSQHSDCVKQGDWSRSEDFCFWRYPLIELAGLTLGLIGFGKIGRAVARLAEAFGMGVLVHDPFAPPTTQQSNVEFVELDTLFRESDVVSLHCPLTEENRGLVNAQRLSQMKRSAFLINTSRGPLVDEAALADALSSGTIAGAGVDVLAEEPASTDCPLLSADNCFITPHIAWATRSARQRLMSVAVDNVRAFLAGESLNRVNAT
jgi:glycerate dehydrogenase